MTTASNSSESNYPGFQAWKTYRAVSMHFNPDIKYNFFEYHGKVSGKVESFKKRKDRYRYTTLERKLKNERDLVTYLAVIFRDNDKLWVGKAVSKIHMDAWTAHKSYMESLSYRFKSDCEKLLDMIEEEGVPFDQLFELRENEDLPLVFQATINNLISIETYIILNDLIGFVDQVEVDDIIFWPQYNNRWLAFSEFMIYDPSVPQQVFLKLLKAYDITL